MAQAIVLVSTIGQRASMISHHAQADCAVQSAEPTACPLEAYGLLVREVTTKVGGRRCGDSSIYNYCTASGAIYNYCIAS